MQSSSMTKQRSCREFSFDEIKRATNDFNDKNFLGEGAFGKVYRATLNRKSVAVKRMTMNDKWEENFKSFQIEKDLLTACNHVNIISLVGVCEEGQERILVYEFMHNGSLLNYLCSPQDGTPRLTMVQRLEICLGVAKGLSYLHSGRDYKNIIHSDLKGDNILLDANLVPKISDFGLSRIRNAGRVASEQVTIHINGTQGFIAPECFGSNYKLSRKADVYSFGVVFLEVLCEMAGYNLVQRALPYIMKRELEVYASEYVWKCISLECAWECQNLLLECLESHAHKRPTADEIVHKLESALKLQKQRRDANKPQVKHALNIPQEFDNLVVLYHTSSGVILKTKDLCDEVRNILGAIGKRVDERDLYLDSSYKEELRRIFGPGQFTLPQLFIGGKYIGGAVEIKRLDWSGELKKKLDPFPIRDYPASCNTCGNMRFTIHSMCPDCCFWKMRK